MLDAIGIIVSDIAASAAFYRLLGLAFPHQTDGLPHLEATTASGVRVMLDTEELAKKLDPTWSRPATQSMVLAFRCEDPAAVDATHAALVAAGYPSATDPWDAFWGQRYAQVLDPDGHRIDLFAPS